jgi:hypothetical protein
VTQSRIRGKAVRVIAAVTLTLGGGITLVTTASPAYAEAGTEVCDVLGHCLNAWDGGPDVNVYNANAANDDFVVEGVDRCNNGDYSTANCPIEGVPAGQFVYQIAYAGPGEIGTCVMGNSSTNGTAELGDCNLTQYPGNGGAEGTIFVAVSYSVCKSGYNASVSRYYTANWSSQYGIDLDDDLVGDPVYTDSSDLQCLDYVGYN